MKRCPDCSGSGTCKSCGGHGEVRIVQGRKKGSTFERAIAKDVSDWTGVEFKRTPMSGGWAKTGDITPKKPKEMVNFPFNIECKNQQTFSTAALMESALDGELKNKAFQSWWKQCTDDAKKSKRVPLLVMTKANEPVYVLMWRTHFKLMNLMRHASVVFRIGEMRGMLWKDFLKPPYKRIKTIKGFKKAGPR